MKPIRKPILLAGLMAAMPFAGVEALPTWGGFPTELSRYGRMAFLNSAEDCNLSDLDLTKITVFSDNGIAVHKNQNTKGGALSIRGKEYSNGIGTHAPSLICVKLNGATHFSAYIGVDDGADQKADHGIVEYEVIGTSKATGEKTLTSGTITRDDAEPVKLDFDVAEYDYLKLNFKSGAQTWADWVDVVDAVFTYEGEKPVTVTESEMGAQNVVNLPEKAPDGGEIVPLSSLDLTKTTCGWGTIKANKSIDGNNIMLKDTLYTSGVGTHATSKIIVKLNGAVTNFRARLGVDDEVREAAQKNPTQGVVDYRVTLKAEDGTERVEYEGTIKATDATTKDIDVDCNGWKYLILEANEGDQNGSDHVDWANAYFVYYEQNSTRPETVTEEEISSKLACATTVFSQPGVRFMQKIRTASPDAQVSVSNLPEGLSWNAERQLVDGIIDKEGTYTYVASVTKDGNTEDNTITLTVSKDLQQPVPFMGWLSWNVVEREISEDVVKTVADAMEESGLRDLGYNYLVIDDLWHAGARQSGTNKPLPDATKFPNGMKPVADYVHSKGLKFGIYSDAANKTCAGAYGSLGYETIDANQYAEWGVDLLKYDYCFAPTDVESARTRYKTMGDALKKSGRNILFYMCEWGVREPWKWGAETGATTWRCTYDTRDCWVGVNGGIGVTQSIAGMKDIWAYSGVNRYNDADMMCVGINGTGKSSSDLCQKVGMTKTEYQTQFSLWCMWASPLTLSFDLRKPISKADFAIMSNEEMIAINQDRMGQQAEFIGEENGLQTYMKDLENGDVAVAVVNLGSSNKKCTIDFSKLSALSADKEYTVRDLWQKKDLGKFKGSFDITGGIKSHETKVYRLSVYDATSVIGHAAESGSIKVSASENSVNVSFPGTEGQSKRVLVSDVEGRVVASATSGSENITLAMQAPKGTYVVNVVCNGKSQSKKFVF